MTIYPRYPVPAIIRQIFFYPFFIVCTVFAINSVNALELDVPYVETPPDIITLMLDIAEIGPDDYVIDLGTGDGRIVIAAAQRGAAGLGIDIDPQRIQEAEANANATGVSDKVTFLEQDIFTSDLGQATVVTMFLNSEVNLRIRPILLEQLRPGTRLVSHNFEMGDWPPDRYEQALQNRNGNFYFHDVYYWVVPADVEGEWQMQINNETYRLSIVQHFQKITLQVLSDGDELVIDKASLSGDKITFHGQGKSNRQQYTFSGNIEGHNITGIVQIQTGDAINTQNWSASR